MPMSLASTEYSLDHHTQPSSLFARTKPEEPFFWIGGVVAALAWFLAAGVVAFWPDAADEWPQTIELAWLLTAGGAVFGLLGLFGRRLLVPGARLHRLQRTAPWLVVLAVLLIAWELVTAKLAWLPVPFFAPPQALLEVFVDDWSRIGISLLYSLRLLATGYLLGAIAGFVTGVSIGWSQAVGYWVHPVLRLLGPLPATAWLPLAFFAFPSSSSASTFLIALATWFPVTVLTWSGVAAVDSAYYDVARTLGAKSRFLILKVAVPAAMPSVFVGLFMGLGASFSVLVVAEMLGVKAGLGWYLQWAQGWAAYANMYALLLVMAVVFSSIITLLFVVRDRTLAWQKGAVKW